jgi:hypothetical protein
MFLLFSLLFIVRPEALATHNAGKEDQVLQTAMIIIELK